MDRNQLIERHRPLVERIARQMLLRLPPSVTWDELVSAGCLGLIEAVDRYDSERNNDFAKFARTRIKGAMLDALRELDLLPRSMRDRINAIQRVANQLEQESGESPDDQAIADILNINPQRVREARQHLLVTHTVSADDNDIEGESLSLLERLPDEESLSADEFVDLQESRDALRRAFEDLPQRLRLLLVLYYVEEMTMQEIAIIMKLTIGRISQLHTGAIETLQGALASEEMVDQRRLALLLRETVLTWP